MLVRDERMKITVLEDYVISVNRMDDGGARIL
jgi:hypothetical protein